MCSSLGGLAPGFIDGFLTPSGGSGTGDLTVTETTCHGLSVRSASIGSSRASNQVVVVPVGVDGLQMTCDGSMLFGFGSVSGTADFAITATASPLDVSVGFLSDNYLLLPPKNATIGACSALLSTQNSMVSNLQTVNVPDALKDTLLGTINSLVGEIIETQGRASELGQIDTAALLLLFSLRALLAICSQLEEETPNGLTSIVRTLSDPILSSLTPSDPVTPLTAENSYMAPNGILALTAEEHTPVDWFLEFLRSPSLDNVAINNIIAGLLDDDGKFVVSPALLGEGRRQQYGFGFADIDVTFVAARVFGLDSFTLFGEHQLYGKYTFGAPFRLEYIYAEVDLVFNMQEKNTDTIVFAKPEIVTENVTLSFNATDVKGLFSAFLASFGNRLAKLPPQTFDLDCLLPTFDRLELTQLETTQFISNPVLTGFSSRGTARLAQGWVDALWLQYEGSLLRALPRFIQEIVRPFVNAEVLTPMLRLSNAGNCEAIAHGTVGSDGDLGFEEAEAGTHDYGQAVDNVNDFASGNDGNPGYEHAVDNINGFRPGYGQAVDNIIGFRPGSGDHSPYEQAANNANNYGVEGNIDYAHAVDIINSFSPGDGARGGRDFRDREKYMLDWGPLKRLRLPRLLPRASFFRNPSAR